MMLRRVVRVALAGLGLVLAGCNSNQPAAAADLGGAVSYTPPPLPNPADWNGLPLPRTDGGLLIVADAPGMQLVIDPSRRTPTSALGDCMRGIIDCVGAGHTLDECVPVMPACRTSKPWTEAALCCPSACVTDYQAARAAGTEARAALKAAYFKVGGCFPGLGSGN